MVTPSNLFGATRQQIVPPCLSSGGRASVAVRPPLHGHAAIEARAHDRASAAVKRKACSGKRLWANDKFMPVRKSAFCRVSPFSPISWRKSYGW